MRCKECGAKLTLDLEVNLGYCLKCYSRILKRWEKSE